VKELNRDVDRIFGSVVGGIWSREESGWDMVSGFEERGGVCKKELEVG